MQLAVFGLTDSYSNVAMTPNIPSMVRYSALRHSRLASFRPQQCVTLPSHQSFRRADVLCECTLKSPEIRHKAAHAVVQQLLPRQAQAIPEVRLPQGLCVIG